MTNSRSRGRVRASRGARRQSVSHKNELGGWKNGLCIFDKTYLHIMLLEACERVG